MNFEMSLNDSFDDDLDFTDKTDRGGIVIPKQTCEHVQYVHLCKQFKSINNYQCVDCENSNENWLCLSCGEIHCSRYINNHGKEHWLFTLLTDEQDNLGHCLTISLQDLAVWCYPCKSYIKNLRLNPLINQLEHIKFGSSITNENRVDDQIMKNLIPPKNPSTIIAIQDPWLLSELQKTDLLSYCYTIKLRSASIDELVYLHSSDYVNTIVSAEKPGFDKSAHRFQIEYNETTLINARFSAGTTIDALGNVLHNHHINGLILTTSPGHRAFRNHGNGTSIYNNLALAINSTLIDKPIVENRRNSLALFDSNNHVHIVGASPIEDAICHMIHVLTPINDDRLTAHCSSIMNDNVKEFQLERVLILDLTSEHGSGLQSIYYESDQVFYISIHQENHQHRSSYHECGKNRGLGYTMNIPLSSIDQITDQDYLKIITELILPMTNEYQPNLILVCVDFQMANLSALSYAWIIEQFNLLTNSKLVVALDGDLSNISTKTSYIQTVLSVLIGSLSVMNNEKWKNTGDINKDVHQKIDLIKAKYKQYWSCFQ